MNENLKTAVEIVTALADAGKREVTRIAKDITAKSPISTENASMVASLVASEVRRQMGALGLATTADLRRLSRKVELLEAKVSAAAPAKPAATKPKAKT